MKERRQEPRIPLEHILYLNTVHAGRKVPSMLLEISASGARIGFPPHEALPPAGSELILQDASLLAPFLENRAATVMWGRDVQLGLRFTQRSEAELADMAKILQSEIFY
jgi:hypothetical protein